MPCDVLVFIIHMQSDFDIFEVCFETGQVKEEPPLSLTRRMVVVTVL